MKIILVMLMLVSANVFADWDRRDMDRRNGFGHGGEEGWEGHHGFGGHNAFGFGGGSVILNIPVPLPVQPYYQQQYQQPYYQPRMCIDQMGRQYPC